MLITFNWQKTVFVRTRTLDKLSAVWGFLLLCLTHTHTGTNSYQLWPVISINWTIKTNKEQKIMFILSLLFSSLNHVLPFLPSLLSFFISPNHIYFFLFSPLPLSLLSFLLPLLPSVLIFPPALFSTSTFLFSLKCWSSARRPLSSTAAWRQWLYVRMRSTTYCGLRWSRRTGTCGGSPTILNIGSGAGRQHR